jgi:hypothetical protein
MAVMAMFSLGVSFRVLNQVALVLAGVVWAGAASAEVSPVPLVEPVVAPIEESCLAQPLRLAKEKVDAFMSAPDGLLKVFPSGGAALSSQTRALAATDISTVDILLKIAVTANPPQKAAIGAGLAQASLICLRGHQELAQKIQEKLAAAQDVKLTEAFVAAANQVEAASLGVGTPAGIVSVGGAPGGGTLSEGSPKTPNFGNTGPSSPGFMNSGLFEGFGHNGGGGLTITNSNSSSPNL